MHGRLQTGRNELHVTRPCDVWVRFVERVQLHSPLDLVASGLGPAHGQRLDLEEAVVAAVSRIVQPQGRVVPATVQEAVCPSTVVGQPLLRKLLLNLRRSVMQVSSPNRALRASCLTRAVAPIIGVWMLPRLVQHAVGRFEPTLTPSCRMSRLGPSLGLSCAPAAGPHCGPWPWPRVWSPLLLTSLPAVATEPRKT